MEKLKKAQGGFTLVEMIITIGVMSILTATIIVTFSIISGGNASKSTANLLNKLDTTQVENMTKSGVTYLYLYKDSDGVQTFMYNDGTTLGLTSRSDMMAQISADKGVVSKIAGSGVNFYLPDGADSKSNTDLVVKIAFEKSSGAFSCCKKIDDTVGTTFYDTISFKGTQTTQYKVKLVKNTGKHMKG